MSEVSTHIHVWLSNGQCSHCRTTKERYLVALEAKLAEVMTGLAALSPTLANDPRPYTIEDALQVVAAEYAALIQDDAKIEDELAEAQQDKKVLAGDVTTLNRMVTGLMDERDALKATVERMQPVVTAARRLKPWCMITHGHVPSGWAELLAALNAGKEAPPPSYTVCVHCGYEKSPTCACKCDVILTVRIDQ